MRLALIDVLKERDRQEHLWGEQNHTIFPWLAILQEEVGEMCHEAMAIYFDKQNRQKELRTELVQVAAVALSMLECLDRNDGWVADASVR